MVLRFMDSYALLSVFDKDDIVTIASSLSKSGYKLITTKGTGKILWENSIESLPIEELTKNPRAFEDCIQAFSFSTAAGILFNRKNQVHLDQLRTLDLKQIDVVVCNFPPLKDVVKSIEDFDIHHVDVGGPFMVRSAAVNYRDVLVIVDPKDYPIVADKLEKSAVDQDFRKDFAKKAFSYTCKYDEEITRFLTK